MTSRKFKVGDKVAVLPMKYRMGIIVDDLTDSPVARYKVKLEDNYVATLWESQIELIEKGEVK